MMASPRLVGMITQCAAYAARRTVNKQRALIIGFERADLRAGAIAALLPCALERRLVYCRIIRVQERAIILNVIGYEIARC